VFENLDGITYIPSRDFAFALAVVHSFSHVLEQDPLRLSRCVLTTIRAELSNTHVWQPYIPHIAFMYASGMKEAETVYCTVGVSSDADLVCSPFRRERSKGPDPFMLINLSLSKVWCLRRWVAQRRKINHSARNDSDSLRK
jgi:hypothetical protein